MGMSDHERGYQYSVVRDEDGPGHVAVGLVRFSDSSNKQPSDAVVLAYRSFRPMLELAEMEAYAAQLEHAAAHATEGKFGCFVETEQGDHGTVRVALYERWFDGHRLRCEQLAHRDFDATDPDAVASSAEFLIELQTRAAARNEEREAGYMEAAVRAQHRAERATDRDQAAHELAKILESHNTPTDAH